MKKVYLGAFVCSYIIFCLLSSNLLFFISVAVDHNFFPFTTEILFWEIQIRIFSFKGILLILYKVASILFWFYLIYKILKEYKKLLDLEELNKNSLQ